MVDIVEHVDIVVAKEDIEHLSYTLKRRVDFVLLALVHEEKSETEGEQGDHNEGNEPSDAEEDLSCHSEEVGGVSEALEEMNHSHPD